MIAVLHGVLAVFHSFFAVLHRVIAGAGGLLAVFYGLLAGADGLIAVLYGLLAGADGLLAVRCAVLAGAGGLLAVVYGMIAGAGGIVAAVCGAGVFVDRAVDGIGGAVAVVGSAIVGAGAWIGAGRRVVGAAGGVAGGWVGAKGGGASAGGRRAGGAIILRGMKLPYLTSFPGIGGAIKQRAEDFFVQEVSLYEPSGLGEHVYFEIQKIGITTFEAIDRIARELDVPTREIGYAGLKDARAISRQVFSVAGVTEERVMGLKVRDIAVQWASRHGNKLRLGHLKGNRFAIRVRGVEPTGVLKLREPLAELQWRGMPNFFGEQRFGRRGNNHLIGAALLRSDNVGVLTLLLGDPREGVDSPEEFAARSAFAGRENEKSMGLWPRRCGMERRILARLIKSKKAGSAVRAIDEKLRRLWISALQSHLFNEVLAKRMPAIDAVEAGDLAMKEENGACFLVEDVEAERARADAFEISATGPLLGYRMSQPVGRAGEIEREVFASHGLSPGDFRNEGVLRVKGARRPLRVKPTDVQLTAGVDEFGSYITVAFQLPAGSFATVLMGELMKSTDDDRAVEVGPIAEDDGGGADVVENSAE